MTERSTPAFDAYADGRENPRFTEWLRERSEPDWTDATTHRFTRELGDDTLADEVFERYLVQDYAFLDVGASALGHAVGHADTMDQKARLADQLSVLTGDENDYFERSFDALDVSEGERTDPSLTPPTRAFLDLRMRAALDGYEEALACTAAGEWVYLTWASALAERSPSRFYLDEWIDLHATDGFEAYVGWLREQLDRYGPHLSSRKRDRVEELFRRTVELEVAFFDAAYAE